MSIFNRDKRTREERDRDEVTKTAQALFQVKEYHGEIWITYDGNLVCPRTMLCDEPVKAIGEMRRLFIERTPRIQRL